MKKIETLLSNLTQARSIVCQLSQAIEWWSKRATGFHAKGRAARLS